MHVGGGRSGIMLKSFKKCGTSNTVHEIKFSLISILDPMMKSDSFPSDSENKKNFIVLNQTK